MNVQVIEKDGKPEWAVIPYDAYQRLLEGAEMLQDIGVYDEVKKSIEDGEELIPSAVTYAILDGANPIRVWREYRGLTQQQVAEASRHQRSLSISNRIWQAQGKRRGIDRYRQCTQPRSG